MIICEVGQNHCGDMSLSILLIREAKENGGDLCKFQLYNHNKLYHDSNIPNCELSFDQAKMLFDYGKEIGIEVFFSVFDTEKVEWCEKIGVKRYKIAYSQKDNVELIRAVQDTGKQLIVSSDLLAENTLRLYCVPEYPASVSFKNIDYPFDYHGFSDHTIGLTAAKIALARGANIIEKHFCYNHQTGIDAPWSMTSSELKELKEWENICKMIM